MENLDQRGDATPTPSNSVYILHINTTQITPLENGTTQVNVTKCPHKDSIMGLSAPLFKTGLIYGGVGGIQYQMHISIWSSIYVPTILTNSIFPLKQIF